MTRSCLSAFDSREADDPSSMAPGFYAFPHEDYDRAPVGPFPTYVEAVTAARAAEEVPTRAAAPSATDRAAVLDCLRVRDLGGDWLGHPSFDDGAHSDAVHDALVRDGLAMWDEFGIHITPCGRRAWADQRIALRDLASDVEAIS